MAYAAGRTEEPQEKDEEEEGESSSGSEGSTSEEAPHFRRTTSTWQELVEEERPRLGRKRFLHKLCLYAARGLDFLWGVGARSIVVDFAFGYHWSSFLSFAAFLSVAVYMLEYAFDSVLPALPSCSRCMQARFVTLCENPDEPEVQPQCHRVPDTVPLDPFGEVAVEMDRLGWKLLSVVILASLANSRYIRPGGICCVLPWIFHGVALFVSVGYALEGAWDFFDVCLDFLEPVDWQRYGPPGADAGWSPPPGTGRNIAEYCRVLGKDEEEASQMAASLKYIWAAWMPLATFSVPFDDCGDLLAYCEVGIGHTGPVCLQFLNMSDLGNSLSCPGTLMDPVLYLAKCSPETPRDPLGCRALVSGQSFPLMQLLLEHNDHFSGAVAFHLLSLATRGLSCPSDYWVQEAQGPEQVPGSPATCRYDDQLVTKTSGQKLVPVSHTSANLTFPFVRCVVVAISACSFLERGHSRTAFRSMGATTCSLLMVVGLLWLLVLRLLSHFKPQALGLLFSNRTMRSLLASRILWGYTAVVGIQVGFTYTVANVMQMYGVNRALAHVALWSQLIIVLVAVLYNTIKYIKLRRQVLSLPHATLFGNQPAPESYSGPDIETLREMGTSSIMYAMYFPGIVFWRFLLSSCILVSMIVAVFWLFEHVFRRKAHRFLGAGMMWRVMSGMLFAASVAAAHYVTRIFMQKCLLEEHLEGIRVRCMCLFSWWEILTCFLGLALGPATALGDFAKGFITTAIAALIVDRPNFTQFGELSDYVFCTYCASLYLERMAEDLHNSPAIAPSPDEEGGHAEFVRLDNYDAEDFSIEGEAQMLMLEEPAYRYLCPARCLGFLLLFVGLPVLSFLLLDFLRAHYQYPCEARASLCWDWF